MKPGPSTSLAFDTRRTWRTRSSLLVVALAACTSVVACGAREKEAAAQEIQRCRSQVKDIAMPALRAQKEQSCQKLEFDYVNRYNQQPERN